jgi:hypothetical protein
VKKQSLLRRIDAMEQQLQDMRAEVLADDALEEDIVQVPGQGAWQRHMLAELYPHMEHLRGVLALLDLAAERAPEPVSYEEVKRRSSLTDRQQRNDHSALTRATKEVFGRRTWPFAWQQTSDGSLRYWMPVRMAAWWEAIRKSP